MANVNQPSGLNPVGHLLGLDWSSKTRRFYIASTDSNAYAIGDPVKLTATSDGNGVPGCTLATAGTGNAVLGVIMGMGGPQYGGVNADVNALNVMVIPATKTRAYYVEVIVDPYVIFEIQDDASASVTTAFASLNYNLVAGTNNGYVSGWQLQGSSGATGNTLQLNVLEMSQRPNNTLGANAKWLVLINNHVYRAITTGV